MTVSALAARALQPQPVRIGVAGEGSVAAPGRSPGAPRVAFADTLRQSIESVDDAQKAADGRVEAFIAGETDNVHDVMIALNQAELHFQLLTEVRNKLLEGYQEIMRMQI